MWAYRFFGTVAEGCIWSKSGFLNSRRPTHGAYWIGRCPWPQCERTPLPIDEEMHDGISAIIDSFNSTKGQLHSSGTWGYYLRNNDLLLHLSELNNDMLFHFTEHLGALLKIITCSKQWKGALNKLLTQFWMSGPKLNNFRQLLIKSHSMVSKDFLESIKSTIPGILFSSVFIMMSEIN